LALKISWVSFTAYKDPFSDLLSIVVTEAINIFCFFAAESVCAWEKAMAIEQTAIRNSFFILVEF
jgi:hypothetical protein